MKQILSDARDLLRGMWAAARSRPVIFFVAVPAAIVAAVAVFFPRDVAISDWICRDRDEFIRDIARRFSAYLDFRLPVEIFLFLWMAGAWKKRRDWQRLGLAIMLAASLAGGIDTSVRVMTGRPRPTARMPDRFTGPQFLDHKLQSFPSAHSATSMATAGVLAVASPAVGVPFLVFSAGVPWARFYQHAHYMSDVVVGGLIGLWFGGAFGLALRRTRPPGAGSHALTSAEAGD